MARRPKDGMITSHLLTSIQCHRLLQPTRAYYYPFIIPTLFFKKGKGDIVIASVRPSVLQKSRKIHQKPL